MFPNELDSAFFNDSWMDQNQAQVMNFDPNSSMGQYVQAQQNALQQVQAQNALQNLQQLQPLQQLQGQGQMQVPGQVCVEFINHSLWGFLEKQHKLHLFGEWAPQMLIDINIVNSTSAFLSN